jgi:hypothetical protein
MGTVYVIFEWLLVIAFIGLIGTIFWIVAAALAIKTSVMRDARRLYEPPLRSGKSLLATGKGIAQQETVRARHIAGRVKVAAGAVKVTTEEVKTASSAIRFSDLKPALATLQSGVKVIGLAVKIARSASARQAPPS